MMGEGSSSQFWTRGSTPGLRACRCGSGRGPGSGDPARPGGPGTLRGRSLGGGKRKSALRRAEGQAGGLGLGRDLAQTKAAWLGAPGPPSAREAPSCPGLRGPGPQAPCHRTAHLRRFPSFSGTGPRLLFPEDGFTIFITCGGWGVGKE